MQTRKHKVPEPGECLMCLRNSEETRTGVRGRMMAGGEVRGPHSMLMKVHRVTGTAQDRGIRGVCTPLKSTHSIPYRGEDTSARASYVI